MEAVWEDMGNGGGHPFRCSFHATAPLGLRQMTYGGHGACCL